MLRSMGSPRSMMRLPPTDHRIPYMQFILPLHNTGQSPWISGMQ